MPAGMVENGNSEPRLSGKLGMGAWLSEGPVQGQPPAIPRYKQGCRTSSEGFHVNPFARCGSCPPQLLPPDNFISPQPCC